jgi:hypothetical protein
MTSAPSGNESLPEEVGGDSSCVKWEAGVSFEGGLYGEVGILLLNKGHYHANNILVAFGPLLLSNS